MEKLKGFFNKIGGLFKKAWNFIKAKKVLFIIIAAVLIVAIVGTSLFFALGKNGTGDNEFDRPQGNTLYTVNVKTVGGMAMSDIDIYIYEDDSLGNMLDYTKTNKEGIATFNLDESADYAIVLTSVPKGYAVEKSYKFDGVSKDITLKSSLVTDADISTASLGLGDVMYDFTVTSTTPSDTPMQDLSSSRIPKRHSERGDRIWNM